MGFDVREGCPPPLLAFLGLSEPALAAEPCPHVNEIESLRVVRKVMDSVAAALAFRALGYVCGGVPSPSRSDVDGRLPTGITHQADGTGCWEAPAPVPALTDLTQQLDRPRPIMLKFGVQVKGGTTMCL